MDPRLILAGAVGLLLLSAAVVRTVVSGPAIAEPTELDAAGVVCVQDDAGNLQPADPEALARGMGMEPNAYALSRVMVSEVGGLPELALQGVAWTVQNHARDVGKSVLAVVTRATLNSGKDDGAGDGYFGKQGDFQGGYRYVSSAQDSTEQSRTIALGVTSGDIDDPTDGAVNFDGPDAYSDPAKREEYEANRAKEGKVAFALPGVDINKVRFWRVA